MPDAKLPSRLTWYSGAFLAAVAIAFVIVLTTGSGSRTLTGRVGADYPAFYSAGQIIAAGEAPALYSAQKQHQYQKTLLGDESGLLPFAYPPFVALAYAPLSQLPFRWSYAVHTLLMITALCFACRLMQRIYPEVLHSLYFWVFFALTYYPMFRSVFGGQNTALSLLLIVLCWHRVITARQIEAGLYLGLLMFKPQFAVPLAGLFLLSGRWRVCAGAAAGALALYALGALVSGPNWPLIWIDAASRFAALDAAANSANAISWLGFSEAVLGPGNPAALTLGWGLTALTILAISAIWWAGGRRADIGAQMALAAICLVLISPHTMYYDMGLILITFAVLLGPPYRTKPGVVAGLWAMGLVQVLSPLAGFSVGFPALLFALCFAIARLGHAATGVGAEKSAST